MSSEQSNVVKLSPSVADQASDWVAKLDGDEMSARDVQELRAWIAEDPRHKSELAAQLNSWSDMDVLSELTYLNAPEETAIQTEKASFFEFLSRPFAYGVASLLVVVSLATYVASNSGWINLPALDQSSAGVEFNIVTLLGEQKTESLPDGSVLHINTTSAAEIEYSDSERSVHLQTGEVFFDIAPEEERPFVVYAGDAAIRAVGTAFTVHYENEAVRIAVTEGVVEFISEGVSEFVSAETSETLDAESSLGNVAYFENSKFTVQTQPQELLSRQLAWRDGMLEFRGESLDYVVAELSRYTDAQFVILDDEIKDVRLGGYFKIGDIDGLASTLDLAFNIKLDVVSEELIQLSRGDIDRTK